MCAMLGYTRDELVGLQAADIVAAEEAEHVDTALREIQGRDGHHREWRLRRKDGSTFPADVVATQFPDGTLLAMVRDVTEAQACIEQQGLAERIAQDEQQFTDTMIESMPGVVYFYDADGRFRRWNRNFEAVTGYTAAEIAGMHPLDFFTGEGRARVSARIAEVFASGESSVDAPLVAKDGSATEYHLTGRRTTFEGQDCLVGVGVDISQRTRAEAALREAELRFHTLFAHTPAGVVVIDPDTLTIVEANARAAQQLGYTLEEFCGLGIADINVIHSRIDARRRVERVLAAGPVQFETQQRTKSGEVREVLVSAQPLELGGRRMIHAVYLDVTEQKAVEAEREMRERAEAADRLKSAFLATMSRELRTPLNSIIGFTGVLLQGLAGPLNTEQQKQLEMVRTSGRHLLALVNDVLDISKIEAGQIEMVTAAFDARHSIAKIADLVAPAAAKAGLSLRVTIDPAVGGLLADERRFEQILLNLLGNAIKFTERGEVAIEAGVVEATPSNDLPTRGWLQVRVVDTGIGIRDEDLPKLFQPFRQVDSGLARKYEGTGLGLAISARLAELMGGTLEAQSRWGVGSIFTLTVPLEAAAQ
jgi:PAS domain S-box-containing protein